MSKSKTQVNQAKRMKKKQQQQRPRTTNGLETRGTKLEEGERETHLI